MDYSRLNFSHVAFCLFALLFPLHLNAQKPARHLEIDRTKPLDVKFMADATFGKIEGMTTALTGMFNAVETDTGLTGDFQFEVALDSLDTGIGLRNKHMREYLETTLFPSTVYRGKIVSILSNGDAAKTEGEFTVHGVTKPLAANGRITKTDEGYRVQVSFPLNFKDFGIAKPRFLIASVNELLKIEVDFYLKDPLQ
jgi:polyisoprenoid-binding protein YceI